MRHPSEMVEVFRANGRKVTAQRQCIFRVLYGDVTHPTAEAVHQAARRQMETISLKTVYQTLHELASLGEIAMLDLGTGTARFDPNVATAHHHLVCRACGKVRDLHADFSALRVPAGEDAEFHLKLLAAATAGLADPIAIVDAQRRELLRRLRDAQRAALSEPDGSDAALLLEGIVLRLQADLHWLEACERGWSRRKAAAK